MKTLKFKNVRIETFAIKEGTVSTCHETKELISLELTTTLRQQVIEFTTRVI